MCVSWNVPSLENSVYSSFDICYHCLCFNISCLWVSVWCSLTLVASFVELIYFACATMLTLLTHMNLIDFTTISNFLQLSKRSDNSTLYIIILFWLISCT